jgi:hypothetical protein
MNVVVELSNDQIATLEHAFTLSDLKKEALAQALLPLAVNAWLDWLSGQKRYNSLTEQYTNWIYEMYEGLLPNETPSANQLYNCFNVPYGQAQYIARVLNNRDIPRLRAQALEELKAKLLEQKNEIYSRPPPQAKSKADIMLSKNATMQLDNIMGYLARKSPDEVDPLTKFDGLGNLVGVKITARTFKKVCERLDI